MRICSLRPWVKKWNKLQLLTPWTLALIGSNYIVNIGHVRSYSIIELYRYTYLKLRCNETVLRPAVAILNCPLFQRELEGTNRVPRAFSLAQRWQPAGGPWKRRTSRREMPSWLVSSLGRALDRYHRGHGFHSRTSLNISFSGFIFTSAQVVLISTMVTYIVII